MLLDIFSYTYICQNNKNKMADQTPPTERAKYLFLSWQNKSKVWAYFGLYKLKGEPA